MQAHDVAVGKQGVQIFNPFNTLCGERVRRGEGVAGANVHTKTHGKACRLARDGTKGHKVHDRTATLASLEPGLFPTPVADTAIDRNRPLANGKEQRNPMFHNRYRISARRVQHRNATGLGGVHTDVVDARTVFGNRAQPGCGPQDHRVDPAHVRKDANRLSVANSRDQAAAGT